MSNRDCRVKVAMLLAPGSYAEALLEALNTCSALEQSSPELRFEHCADTAAALALAAVDGELQAAVIDSACVSAPAATLRALRDLRPELDLLLMAEAGGTRQLPERVQL